MKTFLRRPGNKSKHLRHIIPLIPKEFNTYIEPFAGTGAVFLHLLPKKWIINDINKDIISIWGLVRDNSEYLIRQINIFKRDFLHLNNKEKKIFCRKIVSKLDTISGRKRAVNYLLMLYCSYGGTIFDGNKFFINGLYGHVYMKESVHIFTEAYSLKIKELSTLLKHGSILNSDYKETLKKAKKGDFVFLDPPYIEEKKYSFDYNKNEVFDINDLSKELNKLDNKGVKWMMTQIDNSLVRKLFKKYIFVKYENKGSFNGNNKSSITEVIIMNYYNN